MPNSKLGFTLIELILVVSIISLLVALYASVGTSFLVRNSTINVNNQLVGLLRVARLNSMSGKGGDKWGVSLQSGNLVLFKGPSYTSRDPIFDEKFATGNISVSSFEVVFETTTGETSPISISTMSPLGESNTFSINQLGSLDVN